MPLSGAHIGPQIGPHEITTGRRRLEGLLADDFELEVADAVCYWRAESGETAWRRFTASDGLAKAGVAALSTGARAALHRDWVEYFEQHREGSVPRRYLLVMGEATTSLGVSEP